jgi:ligand-binding sensor domain-containing protein/signal transduction histidine kinase
MKYFILIFVLNFVSVISAEQIHFKHLNIENGLSQSTINCIFQDSQGFIWIGTQDGLNRYDGYSFRIFRPQPNNPYSINTIDIWSIHQAKADSGNVIWLGTHAGGLNIYDVRLDQFHHFELNSVENLNHNTNSIFAVYSTSIGKQRVILIGTQGEGLRIFLLKHNWYRELQTGNIPWKKIIYFRHNDESPNSLSDDDVTFFCEDTILSDDSYKQFWMGTYGGGLNKLKIWSEYAKENDHEIRVEINPGWPIDHRPEALMNDIISSIIIEKSTHDKKVLWLATHDGLKRLILNAGSSDMDDNLLDLKIFRHNKIYDLSLPSNEIYSLLKDQEGNIWVGTYDGLARLYKNANDQVYFESFKHQSNNSSSISENHICDLFEDRAGIIWAGTHGKGLSLYNRKAEKFRLYRNHPASLYRLNDNNVKSIFEDPDEDVLWIGTHNGGLNRINLKTNTVQYFKKDASNPQSIGHNRIIKIYQDREGFLWLGTYGGGIIKFNKNTFTSRQFEYDVNDPESLSDNDVNSIIEDNNGNLWFGTYGGGINYFNGRSQKFTHYHNNPEDENSLSSDLVRVLLVTNDGNVWIGSEGGLSLLDDSGDKITFSNYSHIPGDTSSLSTNHIFCLHAAKVHHPGSIWIGTEGGGINLFDPRTGIFKSYTTRDGLPNDVVYGILEDFEGNLWISTNYGLSKFNPLSRTFTNFTVRDGLQSNEFNFGAFCLRRNGEMWFGGVNGISAFYPEKIRPDLYMAPVVLTNIEVLNKPVVVGSEILKENITKVKDVTLDYSDNVFSLEFTSLHLYQAEKNKYRYMMDGFDNDWTTVDAKRRFVTYTNLDPGNYVFRVKGTNNDSRWSDTEASLGITILPPFWQTWWFRILSILLILGLLYALHRYRLARLLEIERLRVRIASDLHDDVGSALTKIALNSEVIQSSESFDQIKSASRNIGAMSREIITTMSDIIWSIDSRNDSLGNLVDRMRDFAYNVLPIRDIAVNFSTEGLDEEKTIPINFRQNIFLIFKECINNAAKHSKANKVTICLNNSINSFEMKIHDDGSGFDPSMVKNGNGLKNMKMRANRLDGILEINANSGVEITLKMKKL